MAKRYIDADALINRIAFHNTDIPFEYRERFEDEINNLYDVEETYRQADEQEEAIPVRWIERHIEWLNNLGDDFAVMTGSIITSMVNKWKESKNHEKSIMGNSDSNSCQGDSERYTAAYADKREGSAEAAEQRVGGQLEAGQSNMATRNYEGA